MSHSATCSSSVFALYLHEKLPWWYAKDRFRNELKLPFRWYQEHPHWWRSGWDLVGVPLINFDTDKGIAADPDEIRWSFKYWYDFLSRSYFSEFFRPWELTDNSFCHQSRSARDLIRLSKIYFETRSIPIDDLAFWIVFTSRGNFQLVWGKINTPALSQSLSGHHWWCPLWWSFEAQL